MEKKFKKIMAVVGSTLMVGTTIGMAFAAGGAFPSPFVKDNNADYALVYGAGAAASDITGANSINTYLNTFYSTSSNTASDTGGSTTETITTSDFSSAVSISDEIKLGQDDIIGSKLRVKLEDNKLSTLLDTKVSWDNGDGTDSYDIHEEILLTNEQEDSMLKLVTNLDHSDGEDLDSFVVLQNDESLRYRLVFDDELKFEDDKDDAEALKVSILGKDYEIIDFEPDFSEVTISLSEEKVVKKGNVFTVEGVTLTIGDIFDDAVEVNGILVKEEGSIKRIDGIEVQVTDAVSHVNSASSIAIIKVGKDIKREISYGDEYIKDDETWEWDIGKTTEGKQYIGVKYALKNVNYDEDEPEENPISPGESYIFPENYAAVSFDGLTEVSYDDFNVYFDDKDLYEGEEKIGNDIDVAIFEGEKDDSFTLQYDGNEIETDSIYFNYSEDGVAVYFKDIDGDADSDKKGRIQLSDMYEFSSGDVTTIETVPEGEEVEVLGPAPVIGYTYNGSTVNEITLEGINYYVYFNGESFIIVPEGEEVEVLGPAPVIGYTYNGYAVTYNELNGNYEYEVTTTGISEDKSYHVADLVVKDTEIDVGLDLNADNTVYLTLTNELGGVTKMQLGVDNEEFTHLGNEDEDAETAEVNVEGTDVGTRDYDLMDHYGTIIQNPESNGDNDKVVLSIPSEQVFAEVSVKGQGSVITTETEVEDTNETTNETETIIVPQLGGIVTKDSEAASFQDKNLIIVGGSCINAEAAKLLGGKACGEEFTLKTGITAGKALIQTFVSPYNADKVAVVVAGYNAEDTTRAVNQIINSEIDISLGQKTII